jgi:single-strand DNA-binding protein
MALPGIAARSLRFLKPACGGFRSPLSAAHFSAHAQPIPTSKEHGMNVVTITGRLGADPEMRSTASGKAVSNLRIAVNQRGQDEPLWLSVTAWDKTAELVTQYKRKGDELAITGRLGEEQWTAQDGTARSRIVIIANTIDFIGGRADANGSSRSPSASSDAPAASTESEPATATAADEDIPF